MFSIDPRLTHVDAARERVVAIIESVNQPNVAIPGKRGGPQPAKAYVCGVRNHDASFSIYIYLLLTRVQEPVVYAYDRRTFALEDYREAESEGLNFVESMGFMMENVNFRNLPPEMQDELLVRVPLFTPIETADAEIEEAEPEIDEAGQRLARLLGAF